MRRKIFPQRIADTLSKFLLLKIFLQFLSSRPGSRHVTEITMHRGTGWPVVSQRLSQKRELGRREGGQKDAGRPARIGQVFADYFLGGRKKRGGGRPERNEKGSGGRRSTPGIPRSPAKNSICLGWRRWSGGKESRNSVTPFPIDRLQTTGKPPLFRFTADHRGLALPRTSGAD